VRSTKQALNSVENTVRLIISATQGASKIAVHFSENNTLLLAPRIMEEVSVQIGVTPLLNEINDLVMKLVPLEKEVDQEENKDGIPPEKRPPLYASRLKQEYDALNKSYPRLSQLRLIQLLLILSADNIHQTSILLASNTKALAAVQPDVNIALVLLKATEDKERTIAADVAGAIPAKNGGDCRAPLILVK
jgi:hypothetical protein